MNKRIQAQYAAVLETLKAHGCICGYSITKVDINLEWKEGGIERVVREITTNPKPLGLKRSLRGLLLLVLPQKVRGMVDATLFTASKQRYRLPSDH